MTSAAADTRPVTRRYASGIPIDPGYLEHLRNKRKLSRARLAELVGMQLFDRERFGRVLDGTASPDATTLRVLNRVLGCPPQAWLAGTENSLDRDALDAQLGNRGWTRDDLADRVARGWRSRDNVAKWENGERKPKADAMGALCEVLGCEPGELMTGEPSPRTAVQEAAARSARDEYYAGLREFAEYRDIPWTDENGEPCFSADLRRDYDRFLLSDDSLLAS